MNHKLYQDELKWRDKLRRNRTLIVKTLKSNELNKSWKNSCEKSICKLVAFMMEEMKERSKNYWSYKNFMKLFSN